jgi:gliding motility-associated-like protein
VNFRYNYLNGDSVIWNFSDGTLYRSKEMPFAHTFSSKGEKSATLTIFQFGCADSYTSPDGYVIIQEADASFAVSETTWNCYPKEIVFTHNPADTIVRSGTWDFGYNNSTSGYATLRRFNYPRPGEYPASLAVETTYGCRDTAWQTIVISGPTGTFDILPGNRRACRGDDITLRIGETNNVFDFEWDLGDGRFMTGDTVTFAYGRMGTLYPKLILYGDSGICIPPPVVDSVLVYEVIAGMELPDTGYCDQYVLHFANTSTGNTQDFWTFSNGFQTGEHEPDLAFSPGDFTATLMVMNDIGCSDTLTTGFVIHPLPVLVLSPDTLICEGDAVIIRASGGDVIQWTPTAGLSDPGTYMPVASPATTTTYTAQVRYLSTGCSNQDQLLIFVQQEPQISIHPYPDTTIIIGEVVAIRADSIGGVTYSWAPAGWLSCTSCASPVAQPLETTRYTLTLADTNQCFEKSYDLDIEVLEEYSLDVPTAFTPNGDDVNDVVFVKGWGIRKLVEFRVFNRWGNQVFFSDDLNLGWDGTFEGKIQSIDSYAYTVTVEMWDGRIVSKKGTINLIR